MSQDRLASMRAIDPRLLLDVVRQDQRSPTFELLDWGVKRLSDKGAASLDGLFLFSGQGYDERGTRSWSVALKLLDRPSEEQHQRSQYYWKRELLVAQSGLIDSLPAAVVAPRFYGATENDGKGWLWMEYVTATNAGQWTTDSYAFAARQLGRFNGAYLTGFPMPDYSWLTRGHARTMSDNFAPQNAWDNPFVLQFFSSALRERVMRLWEERERFLETLNRLPQTFSHFDFQRRNLVIRKRDDGQDEVVALDWAFCGCGAVGGDLCFLVGSSAVFREYDPTEMPVVDKAVFDAYVAGLRESGWGGDPALARLGYTAFIAIFWGVVLPAGTVAFSGEDQVSVVRQLFGCSQEELASTFASICEYALDRADEACELMSRLG